MQGRGRALYSKLYWLPLPPPSPTPPPPCPAPTLARAYFPFSTSTEAATVAATVVSLTAAALLVANKAAHARPNLCMRRTQWSFCGLFGLRYVVTSETSLDPDLLLWSRFLSLNDVYTLTQRFVSSTGNMEILLSLIHSIVCANTYF